MSDIGSLRVYLGCMFAGKTSEIIREYKRWSKIGKEVMCINYSKDNRYGEGNTVYTHDLETIACYKVEHLRDIVEDVIKAHDVVLINEGQFFEDLEDFCHKWCDTKHIVVSGLDGDYLRRPFGQILSIIPLADEVIKLKAFCKLCNDGTPAIFTKRTGKSTTQIEIGNDYLPVCRKHYLLEETAHESESPKIEHVLITDRD